jgi:predicted DNA-binding transcriptional regulator AlpA
MLAQKSWCSLSQQSTNGKPRNEDELMAMQLLTPAEVAALLQVSKEWVRDHCSRRNPRLPVIRLGGKRAVLRFRLEDIEKFIAENVSSTDAVLKFPGDKHRAM